MVQPSPYTPGAVARTVPGRTAQLAFYTERAQFIANLQRFADRPRVDYAARGIGKTSLLREAQRVFTAHNIATVWVTANEDENLAKSVLDELEALAPDGSALRATLVDAISNATITLGVSAAKATVNLRDVRSASSSPTKAFIRAFVQAVKAAQDAGRRGLVVLIDEVQSADDVSLRVISNAWQELRSETPEVPAGLFTVGLPGSQDRINAAVTFSERFDFRELFGLDEGSAATALIAPAWQVGVTWDDDAVRAAVELARGYPYKVQLVGDSAWQAAGYPDAGARVTRAHVAAGQPEVDRQMLSLFKARWRSATPKQRELLTAVARLGGVDVRREDVAAALGVPTTKLSMARDALLRKGIIDASRHGRVTFTVPGFTEFILDQQP